jgi:cyclophilin family peptidyl-prolyl cis-trans isomerase
MRFRLVAAAIALVPLVASAQRLTPADSALVGRLLLAEDRRDTSTASYQEGLRHPDARIRVIARRGWNRSRDPLFARRDSLPALPPSTVFPQPAWRARFAALTRTTTCDELNTALADSAAPVRIRAADLVTSGCANDTRIISTLKSWLPGLPTNAARRAGQPSWQPAAHAFVALTRTTAQADMRHEMPRFSTSPIAAVRSYAAAAAANLNDTSTLRRLADDDDDNVKEAAIMGLRRIAGHSADDLLIAALSAKGYQAVRAAAGALKETPMGDIALSNAITASIRLRRDSSETSRDARMALAGVIAQFAQPNDWTRIVGLATDFDCLLADSIAAIGRKLGDARAAAKCTKPAVSLPPDAVRLALGADIRVRVTMADASGGGSFVVKLRGDIAPMMAGRVLALAKAGYYDGRPWHRVEHNFVVQGGGGGSEYVGHPRFFRDELGNLGHMRGTIGMSTRGHDTGDAQWFFNLIDNGRLNRDYTVFAEVTEGMDVVDGIFEGDIIASISIIP